MKTINKNVKTVDGFFLNTELSIQKKSLGLVILLHGITGTMHEFNGFYDEVVKDLLSSGYSTLRFDFRGHGKSSGSSLDFSITGQIIDTTTVVLWALKKFKIIPKIHFIGNSFGAMPSICGSIFFKKQTKSLLLLAPVLSYDRTFINSETKWAKSNFSLKAIRELPNKGYLVMDKTFKISWKLFTEMQQVDPVLNLKAIKCNLKIIHGLSDQMVSHNISNEISKRMGIDLISIKEMDHGFCSVDDENCVTFKSLKIKESCIDKIISHIKHS